MDISDHESNLLLVPEEKGRKKVMRQRHKTNAKRKVKKSQDKNLGHTSEKRGNKSENFSGTNTNVQQI